MIYKEQIKTILNEVERTRSELEQELAALPEGELFIVRHENGECYCERLPKKGNRKKERRFGITGDKEKTRALVRKKYVKKAVKIAEKDIEVLTKALDNYTPFDEQSIMTDFSRQHPRVAGYIYRDASELEEWAKNYERQKDFYDEDLTSVAGDGTLMRSRGEIVIAEKLRHYDIPYRYEASLGIPDLPYVPDFTIKRPRDGKIFYWEHFGDVNDREYMRRNDIKLDRYKEYNIVPWDNLIITYDFRENGVNVPLIEGMIHSWLL